MCSSRLQARSKAEITGEGGGERANWPSQSPLPQHVNKYIGHKAYENSCQIDTNTVHNASV